MTRCCRIFTFLAALVFMGSIAWAQSSGNFTYGTSGQTLDCVLHSNGSIQGGAECFSGTCLTDADCGALASSTGKDVDCFGATASTTGKCAISCTADADCPTGETCGKVGLACSIPADCGVAGTCSAGTCSAGTCNSTNATGCNGSFAAAIKTNSGNGNVLVVRPSAVIGLLTDVKIQTNSSVAIGTSSALAGVDFAVTASLLGGGGSPVCTIPDFPVTYDSRFVQISSNLFSVLGATCTTTTGCSFSFAESTVSAHSFDWIIGSPVGGQPGCVSLQSGTYGITADWTPSLGNTGLSEALTCVGPVNVTVEQNKIFSFNTIN